MSSYKDSIRILNEQTKPRNKRVRTVQQLWEYRFWQVMMGFKEIQ